ncbi:hypothetical protein N9D31_03440 [Oligoflexaceae bacterium]|nr:hypothetical protein [Oligoflexaceae bacterium]
MFRKVLCISLSYFLVMTSCKPRRESQLASDRTDVKINDYNGFIVAIEKYKMQALQGGLLLNILSEGGDESFNYKKLMAGLIELARDSQMPHIVRLANISRSEVLYKLGDRDYQDGLDQTIAGMNECKFPISCLTMMAEFQTTSHLSRNVTLSALDEGSALRKAVLNMTDPQVIKDTVLFKLDVMRAYARFIRDLGYPDAVSNYGVSIRQTIAPQELAAVRKLLNDLKSRYAKLFEPHMNTSEAFATAIVSEFKDEGKALTLASLDEETRMNIVSESNFYRSELTQLIITVNALVEQTNRKAAPYTYSYFNAFQVDNTLEGQGKFASLTMFSSFESSIPSRKHWAKAVRRSASVLGPAQLAIADAVDGMVQGAEELMADFLKSDPYFKYPVERFNLVGNMMGSYEQMIVREEPYFQSFPYQVLKLKTAQHRFNKLANDLSEKSAAEQKKEVKVGNFNTAKSAVSAHYMTMMCGWSVAGWRSSSQVLRAEGRTYKEFVAPYECKAPASFHPKKGNWVNADSECKSHAYKLKERDICGTSTNFKGFKTRILDNITKLDIKKLWDPVITKAIILSATALSIIVTMGATSYLAIGAGAAGTAAAGTGAVVTAAQISNVARLGYYALNALVGSAIFTVTNNAILLATGVKKYDNHFWGSVAKEFVIGFGMMLFLPLGAAAGEAIAAKATVNITNEFYKALVTKGAVVGVDSVAFLGAVPASIAVMNVLEGKPGRTWSDLKNLDLKEEVLMSMLFSLGLRMNLKGSYYKKPYSFRQEIKMALGRSAPAQ